MPKKLRSGMWGKKELSRSRGQFRDIERHFRLFESWRRAASAMMSLLSKSPA
jgi:hypothetical protein